MAAKNITQIESTMCPLLTDLAVMTGPARGAVTHKAVDLILAVTVDAHV